MSRERRHTKYNTQWLLSAFLLAWHLHELPVTLCLVSHLAVFLVDGRRGGSSFSISSNFDIKRACPVIFLSSLFELRWCLETPVIVPGARVALPLLGFRNQGSARS